MLEHTDTIEITIDRGQALRLLNQHDILGFNDDRCGQSFNEFFGDSSSEFVLDEVMAWLGY